MEGLRKTGKEMEELIFSWICHMTEDGELWPFFISRVTCLRAWEQVEVQSWCFQRGTGGISLHNMAGERSLEMEEEEEEMEGFQVKCVIHIRGCVPLSYWNPLYLEIVNIYFWPLVVLTNLVFNKFFFFLVIPQVSSLGYCSHIPSPSLHFLHPSSLQGMRNSCHELAMCKCWKCSFLSGQLGDVLIHKIPTGCEGGSWHISDGGYVMSRSCLDVASVCIDKDNESAAIKLLLYVLE